MSTHSRISIIKDGKKTSIYCHWDGYPSHQMPILKNYDTYEKAKELVSLGDLSSLDSTIESSKSYFRDFEEDFMQSSGRQSYNYVINFDEENPRWGME